MTGPEFRALRLRLGLTQAGLAAEMGLPRASGQPQICRWERGKRPIPRRVTAHLRLLTERAE